GRGRGTVGLVRLLRGGGGVVGRLVHVVRRVESGAGVQLVHGARVAGLRGQRVGYRLHRIRRFQRLVHGVERIRGRRLALVQRLGGGVLVARRVLQAGLCRRRQRERDRE